MAKIGFGAEHFSKPTPASISRFVTIMSVVLGTFLLWINSDDNLLPEHATHVVSSLSALIIALCNAIKPFFGVEVTQSSIPTDQVTSIKNE
jgi:hypothetical protein